MFGLLQVNHLAHFFLSLLLLPAMERARAGPDVRIVVTSSAGHIMHKSSDLGLDALTNQDGFTSNMDMYGRSKACNILFASEFQERLWNSGRTNILVNSCHPGTVYTGLNRNLRDSVLVAWLEQLVYFLFSIPQVRCMLSGWLNFADALYLKPFDAWWG